MLDEDGHPRFIWDELRLTGAEYTEVLVASVMERRRWRARYDTAKQAAFEREAACGQRFGNHHQRRSQCGLSDRGKSWRSF